MRFWPAGDRTMTSARLVLLGLIFGASDPCAQAIQVSQPRSVSVRTGGDAILKCTYTSEYNSKIGQYSWYYRQNQTGPENEVSNKTGSLRGRVAVTNQSTFVVRKMAAIRLSALLPKDSGLYICEVELFNVSRSRGNGTWLQVDEVVSPQEVETPSGETIPVSFFIHVCRTVGVLLLFSLAVLLISRYYAMK